MMTPASSCIALIVAAGRGSRFAAAGNPGAPKQYRDLGGMAVLRRAALPFLAHPKVDAVRVVIHADDRALYDEAMAGLDLLPPVHGGESRQDSVRLGLESLAGQAPGQVLIHDAARPFVDGAIIERSLAALARHSGAIAAVPLADSLKRGAADVVTAAVERDGLWRAQTPQAFRYGDILAAHRKVAAAENLGYDRGFTDDAAVMEQAGGSVGLVLGSEENFKITTESDLARAERQLLAALADIRTASGADVHAFGPPFGTEGGEKDHVMLCGVKVPSPRGLVGHSDADVGLHAITDAILGCIADGDIGSHFPPSDPQWKGADSARFLRHAADLVKAQGGLIAHLDVTVLCEAPKVSPHRDAMRARIAEIVGISLARVSVKATTTEKLGFLGRGEGIAAQAVATIRLPAGVL